MLATVASVWFAWITLVGCARPGLCAPKTPCCCEARADQPTSLRATMPCCRVVTRAVTTRAPVTPAPLPPSLLPVTASLPAPSWQTAAALAATPSPVAQPLYRLKCALLL